METPRTKTKLSYSTVWDDTAALLRAHGSLIAALAGAFLFFPALLLGYFGPRAEAIAPDRVVEAMTAYLAARWPWILLTRLIEAAGSLAMLQLVLGPRGTSVGGAIAAAVRLLPFYFLAFLIGNLMVGFGLFLLIVPGLYLMARLAPLAPIFVAEQRRHPIEALGRAFELTKGQGWAILGLILLVGIGGAVTMIVANLLTGTLLILIAGKGLGAFLAQIVGAATGAAFATLLLILYAALYRALAGSRSAAVFE